MKIYNTLTRKKEKFKPIREGKVGIYACGPTVYDYIHVGNARPMVVFDTLRRFLSFEGYDVNFIVNFTDIDDKVINKAIEEGKTITEISQRYIDAYLEDSRKLNIDEDNTKHPKATNFIENIVEFIQGLIKKDAAYHVDGNVYFRINSAKDYGKLSKINIDELKAGARIDVNTDKENPLDFTLWKKSKDKEPYWDSPWGKGRPGWHIECSVMSQEILGETIDIHGGGSDLQFPHHENEIAQSETLTGKDFANYWMHNGLLTINDKKMSKSLGNFFTVRDIEKDYDLEVLRYFLISSHYRMPINFSKDIMDQMENALNRLYNGKRNLEFLQSRAKSGNVSKDNLDVLEKLEKKFISSMRDDLNTADAITALFDLVKHSNQHFNESTSKNTVSLYLNKLIELSSILGILTRKDELLEEDIRNLIEERQEARKNKDFYRADKIRDELLEEGIVLEDTKDGVKWKRI